MSVATGAQTDAAGRPTVSVIIPTHDYARYLRAAVESVQSQTLTDWECVVIDDGSADQTADVLRQLAADEPRLVLVSQARRGPSAARNAGIRVARGEFVQFLDADDLLRPAKLEIHVGALRASAGVDIVYGPTAYFDDDAPTELRDWLRDPPVSGGEPRMDRETSMLSRLLAGNQMTIEAPLVRRSVLDRVRGFDEGLDRMEDWDLWLRCAIAGGRFRHLPQREPLALVRVHPASVSRSLAPMLLREIAVRRKIAPQLSRRADRQLNDRMRDEAQAETGRLIGFGGSPARGLRLLLPPTLRRRRRRWLRWSLALYLMLMPGGFRLVSAATSRRGHG